MKVLRTAEASRTKVIDMEISNANEAAKYLRETWTGSHGGIREVNDNIWLVSFMQFDLGYFDEDECRVEPIDNPFAPKVLPMSSV